MSGTWASGWVTGDVVTAAEFTKGTGAIYNTTLGAGAASIDITGIIADYAHLLIVWSARSDTALTLTNLRLRFNNDSGSNYSSQIIAGVASAASASESILSTSGVAGTMTAASGTTSMFGSGQIIIPNYAGTTSFSHFTANSFALSAGTSGGLTTETLGGFWNSTAAINRVTLFPNAGSFIAGTRVTIYGMGA